MKSVPLYHVWEYTDVDREFWREHLENWLPQRIFDAHTHFCEPKYRLAPITEQQRRDYWVNEVNDPIGAADAQRCYETVFPGRDFSCLAFGMPTLDYDLEACNTDLQKQCEKRGWYSLAVIGPQWSAESIATLLGQPGMLGVKVYYSMIGQEGTVRSKHLEADIFDFLPHHQLEVLNELRGWVMLHVPKADRLGHPANIAQIKEIRKRYPNVVLVIAHLGRCYTIEHAKEALPQLADDQGLYFDNSAVLNPEVHRFALETLGANRILYGTDNPVFYMRGRRQWQGKTYTNRTSYPFYFNKDREPPEVEATYTLYMYEALYALKQACENLGLTRQDVEAIFNDNARRLIDSPA
ncbi:MAG: amidohydrolase [Phycisphaerae bacterium]|nr:amidohydrolase [Phycisphaerae bacterium]